MTVKQCIQMITADTSKVSKSEPARTKIDHNIQISWKNTTKINVTSTKQENGNPT